MLLLNQSSFVMRLLLVALLLAVSTVAEGRAIYENLIGHSRFSNKSEIEKFIMGLSELNSLQRQINGEPDVASDPTGESFLDAVGRQKPLRPNMLPYLFEGDIILSEAKMNALIRDARIKALFKKLGRAPPRKRSLTSSTLWSLPIPYSFDDTGVDESAVHAGIKEWSELTCVTFRQYDDAPSGRPSLQFTRGEPGEKEQGCYSSGIGRETDHGTQIVSIGDGCDPLGIVTHEIAHALGMWHEQARPERDDFITVYFDEIPRKERFQYYAQSYSEVNNYGVRYDYGSVMHYDEIGFSKHGRPTITTNDRYYQSTIGQTEGPSFADVKQINAAYCKDKCAGSRLNCKAGGYPDPKKCAVCRCPSGLGGKECDEVEPSTSSKCGETDLSADHNLQEVEVAGKRDCYYRIKAPAGRRVFLRFETIVFPQHERDPPTTLCEGAFAEVKYRQNVVVSGARICDFHHPKSITSEADTVLILYKGSSRSRLSFSYRFDPATPVDTTVAPTSTSTSRPTTTTTTPTTTESNCGGASTSQPPTTRRPARTTTSDPASSEESTTEEPSWTTTPKSTCKWSKCSGHCGGCGTQIRKCHGKKEARYCGMKACPGRVCCLPFTDVVDGVCYTDENPDDGDYWESPGSWEEKKETPNAIPEGETTTTITRKEDKPHGLPLQIQLPEQRTADANNANELRASRVSAKYVQTARRVPVVKGSGDAPTTGDQGHILPFEVEGSGTVEG